MEENNISPIQSDFERIKKRNENDSEYWTSRELCIFRKVENIHLSRIACLMIAENADSKKPQVQMAREYFKQEISTSELIDNGLSSNILLYKTKQGESRILIILSYKLVIIPSFV